MGNRVGTTWFLPQAQKLMESMDEVYEDQVLTMVTGFKEMG